MNVKKTPWSSYCLNDVALGCKYCVRGEKLVIFISGVCSVNCFYCSLSDERKNKDVVFANERPCKSPEDAIKEAEENNAAGAGITGGDPLLFLDRTIEYASALKKRFGKDFHIHIYLPMKMVSKEKLEKLRLFIDEVRFHPEFLIKKLDEKEFEREMNVLKEAALIFGKENIGIELPILPDKKEEILDYVRKIADIVGFVNFNELEISDSNLEIIEKQYALDDSDYNVPKSKEAGMWILRNLVKESEGKIKLKVHLCTAETKMAYQYTNRLRNYNILPYGEKTKEGLVVYFAIYPKEEKFNEVSGELKGKEVFIDEKKKRIIIPKKLVGVLNKDYKITRVEEYPTFDGIEVEERIIN